MPVLRHLSEAKLEELRASVLNNLARYAGDGFQDQVAEPGWSIELTEKIDLSGLEALDGSDNRAAADLANTKVVWNTLSSLPPSLANEERIWVRLSHIEAFAYSKNRWLRNTGDPNELAAAVSAHFFAHSQTRLRDDHALSRLWWNGYVVSRCYGKDINKGLELLLTSADVRSNIIERIWLTGRRGLARGVFRLMQDDPRVLASERSFREFMKALNLLGGGVVFESMADQQIDEFLSRCADRAAAQLAD